MTRRRPANETMDTMDLFEMLGIEVPSKKETEKAEPKKAVAKNTVAAKTTTAAKAPVKVPETKKSEQKVKYPLTILTGICEPMVLNEGDADTLDKVVKLVCENKGWKENLCVAKAIRDNLVIVTIDRAKVKNKGEFTITDTTVIVVGNGEEYSAAAIAGSKTAEELAEFVRKETGMDASAEFSFVESPENGRVYALLGVNRAFLVDLPITVKSFAGEMVVEAKDLANEDTDGDDDEEDKKGKNVDAEKVIDFLEKSPMFSGFAGMIGLFVSKKEKKKVGESSNNVVYLDVARIVKETAPAKPKETMYPTDAVISLIFTSIQLSPDMFGGKKEVPAKDIITVLAVDHPEYAPERTVLTYYKDGNYIFPSLKSSSKGADSFGSREECLAAAENRDYYLAYFNEDGKRFRYEKTFVSETIAAWDGEGSFTYKLPKIPAYIIEAIRYLFRAVNAMYQTEALVWLCWDIDKKEYFVQVPEQNVSKISVYTEDMDLLSVRKVIKVADIHSHNTTDAYFSGVDDADEKGNIIYGVMGRIDEERPKMCFRAGTGGWHVPISIDDIVNENAGFMSLTERLLDEFSEKASIM